MQQFRQHVIGVGAAYCAAVLLVDAQESNHRTPFFLDGRPTVTNLTRKPVSVPVEIHQEAKIFLVRAKVGKNLEGRFLVDTGSAQTFVTPAFAHKIRMEFSSSHRQGKGDEPALGVSQMMHVPLLALGAMQFENFAVTTMSLEHLSRPLKTQLDGIIGGDLLFARRCAFSAASRRLILDASEPVGVKPITGAGGWMVGVPLTLDGQTKMFLLDSGASRSVLPEREWKGAVVDTGRVMRGDYVETLVGLKTCTAAIKDLRVGETPLPWLKLTLTEGNARLLGADFISHFLLTIDAEYGKVWLQPPSAFAQ
ncbi:MAG: aspartyl protease family protein [Kiritimatiellaeota bacterium]|nr:aspartyl protease family protein [Kiritimatiellota bacterium]